MTDEPDDPGEGDDPTSDPSGAMVIQLLDRARPGADAGIGDSDPDPDSGSASAADSVELEGDPSGEGAVVLVDQRLRQRRIAVRRDAGHRRLRRLAWVLLPVALLVAVVVVIHLPMFDVNRIEVLGSQQLPAATVAWASGIDRGDALATVDEQEAERRIERLSWVEKADVVRQWPDRIRIQVTERRPAAVLDTGEEQAPVVVDEAGRVLDIGGVVPYGLIILTGVSGPFREGGSLPSSALPALHLATRLNIGLPGVATTVSVDFEAELSEGGIARFGSLDGLEDKLVSLETMLSDVDMSCLELLDLRVPGNTAVRRGDC